MHLTFYQPLWFLLGLLVLGVGFYYTLVDRPRKLMWASFLTRCLAVVLLVLALCRPGVTQSAKDIHVVFLVDVSQSVDVGAARGSLTEVKTAVQQLKAGDSHTVFAVANGLRAMSVEEMDRMLEGWQKGIADDAFRSASRLSESLQASRLAFPAGKSRRLVVLTDGLETHGDFTRTLDTLRKENVNVVWKKLAGLTDPEASVVSIEPSTPNAFSGEVVRMRIRLAANQQMKGKVHLVHQGVKMLSRDVSLAPDKENLVEMDVDMRTTGASLWTAELEPEADHFTMNNQATATVQVKGHGKLLIVHQNTRDMRPLSRALQEQEFEVDVRGKNGVPETLEALMEFDAIVLADIPATDISPRQMELIKRYVIDFGGGLAMLGSENSFGLGGYYKTPVEDVLPLISRFEKEKEKPSLAMVLVIDKSGSMEGANIELARQAAKASVELLGPQDQVGVIGFDSAPQLICEMKRASDKDAIQGAIDTLQAGGGTDMFPAMVEAKKMLDNAGSKIRHMICLSDGQTKDRGFAELAQSLKDSGITVSTVAMGDEADAGLMKMIAEVGGGRDYVTNDPANVPQIFTRETMQASKSAIKEEIMASVIIGDHPILSGYRDNMPDILGYVMTEAKPATQVLMAAESGDPLLAVAQFGLGQGLCWTSDLTEKWGGMWLGWEGCGKFWAQVFRGIIRRNNADGLEVRATAVNDVWHLEVSRKDEKGNPVSRVKWDAGAIDQNGREIPLTMVENGLGRYRGEISLAGKEKLTLRVRDLDSDKVKIVNYNRPCPPEYRLARNLPPALGALASFDAQQIRDGIEPVRTRQAADHTFYFLALGAALGSILLRRI